MKAIEELLKNRFPNKEEDIIKNLSDIKIAIKYNEEKVSLASYSRYLCTGRAEHAIQIENTTFFFHKEKPTENMDSIFIHDDKTFSACKYTLEKVLFSGSAKDFVVWLEEENHE